MVEVESPSGDLEKDMLIANAWIDYKAKLIQRFDNIQKATVQIQFESSYDDKTHHTFSSDEVIFLSDVKVSPKGNIVYVTPHGSKDKTFEFSESELIEIQNQDNSIDMLNDVIAAYYKETIGSVLTDAPTITLFERKYISPNAGMAAMLNDPDAFVKTVALTKDRSELYSKIENYGLF